MFYLIQDNRIVHKGYKKLRQFVGEYIESDQDIEVGSTFVNGEWITPSLSSQQQIDALESSISARRWREAYLGDEEAKAFIKDVNSKIKELRESL